MVKSCAGRLRTDAVCSRSMMSNPPMPEPMCTPTRSSFSGVILQARHLERFIRGGDGQVDEASHLLDFFFLDEVERVEVLDFSGDLAGEICWSRTG